MANKPKSVVANGSVQLNGKAHSGYTLRGNGKTFVASPLDYTDLTNAPFSGTVSSASRTTVSVVFPASLNLSAVPMVVVTPTTNAGAFHLSAVNTKGFTITYGTSGAQTFNYTVSFS
jgi:hypothetical protein